MIASKNITIDSLKKHGDKIYLIEADKHVTYKELASHLSELNLGLDLSNKVIGINSNNPLLSIALQWYVLLEGGAFLPINNTSTKSRKLNSFENCDYLIVDLDTEEDLDNFNIVGQGKSLFEHKFKVLKNIAIENHLENCAYVLQTSGSTGIPKLVKHSNESLDEFTTWSKNICNLNEQDKILSISPFYFDMSLFDIFSTAKAGASLTLNLSKNILFPTDFVNAICDNDISVIYLTPGRIKNVLIEPLKEKIQTSKVRLIILAGECFNTNLLKKVKEYFPKGQIFNFYGPTETNVCAYADLSKSEDVYLESSCSFSNFKIADDGELLVSGKSVTSGYLNNEIEKDIISIKDEIFYKTGDIVEITNNGFKVLHRKDNQIKRRGYRFSLKELENEAEKILGLDCYSILKDDKILLLVVNTIERELHALKKALPSYMLPDEVIFCESVLLSSTGKVDVFKTISSIEQEQVSYGS